MATVRSKDGTTIGFDKKGKGPAVILVEGAMGYRAMGFEQQAARPAGGELHGVRLRSHGAR